MPRLHAGLDVGDKLTAICVVDEQGQVVLETTTGTHPTAIALALKPYRRNLKSVGQETGTRAAWLHKGLEKEKLPIHSLDPWHTHTALKARINKTDTNDARGIAMLMARGLFTSAFIKSDEALRIRVIMSLREALLRKTLDLSKAVRSADKVLGADDPQPRRKRKPSEREADVAASKGAIVRIVEIARGELEVLNAMVLRTANDNAICSRLMTIPGVGAITALTFVAAVDDPSRFSSSREIGPYFGLSPRTFQSGTLFRSGGISRRGDHATRKALFIAAHALLSTSRSQCSLRKWGLKIKAAKGHKVAATAVARKLGALMHHLWVTGEEFDPSR